MEDFVYIFNQYGYSELMVLIPVVYFLTKLIRASKINNRWLPLMITGVSILLCAIYTLGTVATDTFSAWMLALFMWITQGILFAGAGIFGSMILDAKFFAKLKDPERACECEDEKKEDEF